MLLHRCFELAGIYGIVVSGSSFVRLKITVPAISKWQITLVNLIKMRMKILTILFWILLDLNHLFAIVKLLKKSKKEIQKREFTESKYIFIVRNFEN
jgi:hypothetical protein